MAFDRDNKNFGDRRETSRDFSDRRETSERRGYGRAPRQNYRVREDNEFRPRMQNDGPRDYTQSFRNENSETRRDFGERREFKPRFSERRFEERPQDTARALEDGVIPAVGDADAAPQVAVGGIKEVTELLTKSPMQVHRVLFMHKSGNPKLYELQKLAKRAHVHVQQVDSKILNSYATPNHGVVALMNEKELLVWEDVRGELFAAKDKGEKKLIAVATNIEDPRNLGACIRSCLALGCDLLLLPAKGMCGITPSVARTSAGALEKMRICRPNNLEAAVGELKQAGYQILGLDADTETNLADFQFSDQAVIAVGGEDVGLPPFIKKQCDAVLRIPMMPEAHSYNASVALSLGLYEYARLRIK